MQTTTRPEWTASDLTSARPIGHGESIIEFRTSDHEWIMFEVLLTPDRIVFGGCCNVGFMESGFIIRDDGESIYETLSALLQELETFYEEGESLEYCNRIVVNDRM